MLTPDQVTAVIVTRGDVDLTPVLDSLIFDDVLVWDNSRETDFKTWGRYASLAFQTPEFGGKNSVFYSQDDDIVHTAENQRRIIEAYEPGVLTGCMWPEWSLGAYQQGIDHGYDDLVFPGSGSVFDLDTVTRATNEYLSYFDRDDFFFLWADTIVGVIAPTKQLDIRFDALPCAESPNRMCNLPDAVENKTEAINRARWIRSGAHIRAVA